MNIKRMQKDAKSLVSLGKNIFFTEVYFDKNTKNSVYLSRGRKKPKFYRGELK